ncbi:hypothetical protein Cus16_3233 [Curtobacterium sp. ER1/6]|nr:hypothetical protein Cus16_3233 [Curtobacterium sp. ER1/6]
MLGLLRGEPGHGPAVHALVPVGAGERDERHEEQAELGRAPHHALRRVHAAHPADELHDREQGVGTAGAEDQEHGAEATRPCRSAPTSGQIARRRTSTTLSTVSCRSPSAPVALRGRPSATTTSQPSSSRSDARSSSGDGKRYARNASGRSACGGAAWAVTSRCPPSATRPVARCRIAARGISTGHDCRNDAVTRSNRSSPSGAQVATSAATKDVRSPTPAAAAARRPRSTAVSDRSTPVAVHPCSASHTTSPPSPQPRSSARPAPRGSVGATAASTAFTRPDQMPSPAAYRASHHSRAVVPASTASVSTVPPPCAVPASPVPVCSCACIRPVHRGPGDGRKVRCRTGKRRDRHRGGREARHRPDPRLPSAAVHDRPPPRPVRPPFRPGPSDLRGRWTRPASHRPPRAYRREHDEIVRCPRHAGLLGSGNPTPRSRDRAGRGTVVMQGARHVDVRVRPPRPAGPGDHLPHAPPCRTSRVGGAGRSGHAVARRPRPGARSGPR